MLNRTVLNGKLVLVISFFPFCLRICHGIYGLKKAKFQVLFSCFLIEVQYACECTLTQITGKVSSRTREVSVKPSNRSNGDNKDVIGEGGV